MAGSLLWTALGLTKKGFQGLWRVLKALYQYARGDADAHRVQQVLGDTGPAPVWVGPAAPTPFSAAFVQESVRGRGKGRAPNDLLVDMGGTVARLERGHFRGRTKRHGYLYHANGVRSCSHRGGRRLLEASMEGDEYVGHLCSPHPCTLVGGSPGLVHARAAAVLDASSDCHVGDLARQGAWTRTRRIIWWLLVWVIAPCRWTWSKCRAC